MLLLQTRNGGSIPERRRRGRRADHDEQQEAGNYAQRQRPLGRRSPSGSLQVRRRARANYPRPFAPCVSSESYFHPVTDFFLSFLAVLLNRSFFRRKVVYCRQMFSTFGENSFYRVFGVI